VSHRISNFLLVCICFVALAQPVWSQNAKGKGIPGYLDPQTGAFTPMVQNSAESAALAATTPTTGKFVFNFTITVNSAIPKNGVIGCDASADVFESTTGQFIHESASALATHVSGTTWTCSVSMPYSWVLSTPSTDKATLSYHLAIVEAFQITASNATASTVVAPIPTRESNQNIGSINVPLNGSTTTETVTATI